MCATFVTVAFTTEKGLINRAHPAHDTLPREVQMKVSAVIVSRMDHPLGEVVDSIAACPEVEEIIIVKGHAGVWERYEAISRAKCEVIYTQDDDAVVAVEAILREYDPEKVTCNMLEPWRKDYQDGIALVGWGAVFDRELAWSDEGEDAVPMMAGALLRYYDWDVERQCDAQRHVPLFQKRFESTMDDPIFRRECDRVFTGLSPLKLIDVGKRDLAWANDGDRMCRRAHDPVHGEYLREIRRRIYAVRAAMEGK